MIKTMQTVVLIVAGTLLILVAAGVLFIVDQNKQGQQIMHLTTVQKLEDFDTLCDVLDESYPFWTEVKSAGIDKMAIYNTYRKNIEKSETDIAFFKEIQYFLNEFQGYGHLSVLDGHLYKLYGDTLAAGSRLLTVQELAKVEPLAEVLSSPVSQNTYGLLDKSHAGFRSTIGLKDKYTKTDTDPNVQEKNSPATKILEGGKAAYISIPSFALTNYQTDKAVLAEFFEKAKESPNLILDVRGNSGGSDLYWKELLVAPNTAQGLSSERYFLFNLNGTTKKYVAANLPDTAMFSSAQPAEEDVRFPKGAALSHYTIETTTFEPAANPYVGKVWVLVDEKVYSASENFAMFCKNSGFATLVGTATGGDGGIADPMLISLPKSGLIVRFSIFYGLNADGTGNEADGTTPDITGNDGGDALEKCLEQLR